MDKCKIKKCEELVSWSDRLNRFTKLCKKHQEINKINSMLYYKENYQKMLQVQRRYARERRMERDKSRVKVMIKPTETYSTIKHIQHLSPEKISRLRFMK